MTLEDYKILKKEILIAKSKCLVRKESDCIFPERCAACGGEYCCKHSPCIFAPEEFLHLENRQYMLRLLRARLIIIAPIKTPAVKLITKHDYVLGIRARGKEDPPFMATNFPLEPNPCALLTDHGCLLDYTFRPTEGLLAVPNGKDCIELYDSEDKVKDWAAHEKTMRKLVAKNGDTFVGVGTITSENVEEHKRLILD